MEKFKSDNVKKRFKNDKKFHEDYPKFMQDMINKSHFRVQHETKFKQSKAYYIHHHAVFSSKEAGKTKCFVRLKC